ncbi:unnamed protein product [Closterium sp. NIES-53]
MASAFFSPLPFSPNPTQRRREEMAEQNAALQVARIKAEEAIQARNDFLSVMNHEMRSPLHTILALSSLMEEDDLTDEQGPMVATLSRSASMLTSLISDVIGVAQRQEINLVLEHRPFDLRRMLHDAASLAWPMMRAKGLSFSVVIAREVPRHVVGDERRLLRVVLHIIGHAIDSTDEDTISVSVGLSDGSHGPARKPHIEHPSHAFHSAISRQDHVRVRITVTDSGGEESKQALLDRFEKAREREQLIKGQAIEGMKALGQDPSNVGIGLFLSGPEEAWVGCTRVQGVVGPQGGMGSELARRVGDTSHAQPPAQMPHPLAPHPLASPPLASHPLTRPLPNTTSHLTDPTYRSTVSAAQSHLPQSDSGDVSAAAAVESAAALAAIEAPRRSPAEDLREAEAAEAERERQARISEQFVAPSCAICQKLLLLMDGHYWNATQAADPGAATAFSVRLLCDRTRRRHRRRRHMMCSLEGSGDEGSGSEEDGEGEGDGEDGSDGDESSCSIGAYIEELEGIRVLLVEDNVANRIATHQLLLSLHCHVTLAASTQECLSILSGSRKSPSASPIADIVLLDICMPDVDGLEAARCIHKMFRPDNRPFIVGITARTDEALVAACGTVGMDEVLLKPKKKEEEARREKELNDLFRVAISQPKVPPGVDPKSIVCEFFRHGQCTKGFKCKFSHDLSVERKGEKIDLYSDQRENDEDKMEDWDQAKLEQVVASKGAEYKNANKPTEIVCKHFLEAVEKKQYGWFWACPNGGKDCMYRHALPPGYVLKSQMKALLEEEQANKLTVEEMIENERKMTASHTQLTTEIFMEWKRKKQELKDAEQAAKKAARAKEDRMSGRELFLSDASLFIDDDAACDAYERVEEEEGAAAPPAATPGESSSSGGAGAPGAGPSSAGGAAGSSGLALTEEDEMLLAEDDDELAPEELEELEAELAKTSIS